MKNQDIIEKIQNIIEHIDQLIEQDIEYLENNSEAEYYQEYDNTKHLLQTIKSSLAKIKKDRILKNEAEIINNILIHFENLNKAVKSKNNQMTKSLILLLDTESKKLGTLVKKEREKLQKAA